MFSKACEYGIKAALFIAQESLNGQRVSLKAIAKEIDSPEAFTAKILQSLARNEIITSTRGLKGGFEIEKNMIDTIKLSQIVDVLDGDSIYKGCGLGLKECNAKKPCPVHFRFEKIRGDLKIMLESTNLFELATGLETGLTYLKR
jgi:Rrf2 family transcriptional regulator, iron-sulfur cluster assembly transcription factor